MTDSMSVTSMSEDEKDIQPIKRVKKNPKKDEMKVFLRIRPLDSYDTRGPIGVNEEERCLKGVSHDEYLNQRIDEFRGLKFNRIFKEDCKQDEFYSEVILPVLPDIFHEKKSSLIFAYGVTNSGKTHSIMGSKKYNPNGDGILPRVLFFLVEAKKLIKQQLSQKIDFYDDGPFSQANKYETLSIDGVNINIGNFINHQQNPTLKLQDIQILFENFEIYNEDIYDLQTIQTCSQPPPQLMQMNNMFYGTHSQQQPIDLKKEKRSASKHNTTQKSKLKIKEKYNKKVYIKDLVTNEIDNAEQIGHLIKNTIENRQVRNNNINMTSSRSQCCFKIRVKFVYAHAFHGIEEEASLLILDLAGAERAKKTNNTGYQMTESCHINKTLLCLGNCIRSLRNGDDNMPYRESKLTRILNEYFVDQNNVLMVVHIHPGISYTEENFNVLKYAAIGLEAKLKAAAPVYEGTSKYSFLMDSAQKSQRHDKSYISNISIDPRSNYRDNQSIDQAQLFTQIEHLMNSDGKSQQGGGGGIRGTIYNEFHQFRDDINLDTVMNYEMSKAFEEKEKQIEDKYKRELELKEVMMQQKRAIENFDMQFENMITEEQNKLKFGQSLFNQFKIPEQIMYGNQTEEEVNNSYLESLKKSQTKSNEGSIQNSRKIMRISSQKFKRNTLVQDNENSSEQENLQNTGSNENEKPVIKNATLQSEEIAQSQLSNNKNSNSNPEKKSSIDSLYIRGKTTDKSQVFRISQANYIDGQIQTKPNSAPSDNYDTLLKLVSDPPPNYLDVIRAHSSNYEHVEPQKQNKITPPQLCSIFENQSSSQQNNDGQIYFISGSLQQSSEMSVNASQKSQNNNVPEMIAEVQQDKQEQEQQQQSQLQSQQYQSQVFSQDSKCNILDQNIESIHQSSVKKISSQIILDSEQESYNNQLLESLNISETNDNESENNKSAPNSINSSSNLDQQQRNSNVDMLSVSQQLLQLKVTQEKEKNNLQQSLYNCEEELKLYLEVDLDENNLKKQILDQSQKLMQLIKDKEEEIDLQRKYFTLKQDSKQKEEERKMKQFEDWIQQIQQELKIQSRYLEQKEVILSQQQMELATLQSNLQEKYRIQQEQIQENLLASDRMKEQIQTQESRLREETEKIVKLQQKLEEEMQMLIKEKTLLGMQKFKSEEIKSIHNTPSQQLKKKQNVITMDVESQHQDHHVNFDLKNLPHYKQTMEEEMRVSTPKRFSGSYYPGHIPSNQNTKDQEHSKTYAEKQIQTSAFRPANKHGHNNSQNQTDVSVYTYYTYSEAEQVHPNSQNNINSSSVSQQEKENNQMNTSTKNKLKGSQSQSKQVVPRLQSPNSKTNSSQLMNSSIKLCQQSNTSSNNSNLQLVKEEQLDKTANKNTKAQNQTEKTSNSKIKQNNVLTEISNDKQNTIEDKNQAVVVVEDEDQDEQKNDSQGEQKRQRGRKKNGKKKAKAKSKERTENTSIDSSVSRDSYSESESILNENTSNVTINIAEKDNTSKPRKGRGRRNQSVSSDKSRNSSSSAGSQKSPKVQPKQAKSKKQKNQKGKEQQQISSESEETSENEIKSSARTNTRNGRKNKNSNK